MVTTEPQNSQGANPAERKCSSRFQNTGFVTTVKRSMIVVIGRSLPFFSVQRVLTKANKTSSICIAIDRQRLKGLVDQ